MYQSELKGTCVVTFEKITENRKSVCRLRKLQKTQVGTFIKTLETLYVEKNDKLWFILEKNELF